MNKMKRSLSGNVNQRTIVDYFSKKAKSKQPASTASKTEEIVIDGNQDISNDIIIENSTKSEVNAVSYRQDFLLKNEALTTAANDSEDLGQELSPSKLPFGGFRRKKGYEQVLLDKKELDEIKQNHLFASSNGGSKSNHQELQLSNEQQEVLRMVVEEGKNVFYTGAAGTGKSLLLKRIIEALQHKNVEICAPTGIAAVFFVFG
jgi:phosphate starvation-inducible protein PhoH